MHGSYRNPNNRSLSDYATNTPYAPRQKTTPAATGRDTTEGEQPLSPSNIAKIYATTTYE